MEKFNRLISRIFQPFFMPTYGMMLLMNMDIFTALPSVWRWIAIGGTFIFTGGLPAMPIFMLMRKGAVGDMFISRKEERTVPYLFSLIAYVFWSMFMFRTLQFPMFIVAMGIGSAVSILIVLLVNLKWKISAHMSGAGGLVAAIFGVCYRMAINPVWLFVLILTLSAMLALSRIELKAHTPAQTLAGFVVGFTAVFLPCFVF